MIEPVPTSALDSFLGVSLLFLAYFILAILITSLLLSVLPPLGVSPVLVFLVVAGILGVGFWPLFKKYYPEQVEV